MSTIKSSNEDITINADGSGRSVKFQANGVEVASIDSTGALTVAGLTSTGIDDNATDTSLTIGSTGTVMIQAGTTVNKGVLQFSQQASTYHIDGGNNIGYLGYSTGGYHRWFGSDGSEDMRIDSAGDVKVTTGNLVIGTAGKGIDFSATANGSGTTTSELLDDYEEGTWTPRHIDGTTLGTVGVARYTKIGNAVTINIDVQFTKSSAGITGMPFTSITNTNQTFNVGYSATSGNNNYAHMNGGTTTIGAWYNVINGNVQFAQGDRVMVGGTYFTES